MRSDLAVLALVLQQLQRDDARHDHKADEVGDRTRDQQRQTADDSQQQWWCFTKGGEMLETGVDTTPIADGDAFEITLTEGY